MRPLVARSRGETPTSCLISGYRLRIQRVERAQLKLAGNSDRVRLVLAKLQFPARRRWNLSEYAPHSERRASRAVR